MSLQYRYSVRWNTLHTGVAGFHVSHHVVTIYRYSVRWHTLHTGVAGFHVSHHVVAIYRYSVRWHTLHAGVAGFHVSHHVVAIYRYSVRWHTLHAGVAGFHVSHHVVGARLLLMESGIRYDNVTRLTARAPRVHLSQDVSRTTNVYISGSTTALPHASVVGCLHHDHRATFTGRVEHLPLTVLHHTRRPRLYSHIVIICIISLVLRTHRVTT